MPVRLCHKQDKASQKLPYEWHPFYTFSFKYVIDNYKIPKKSSSFFQHGCNFICNRLMSICEKIRIKKNPSMIGNGLCIILLHFYHNIFFLVSFDYLHLHFSNFFIFSNSNLHMVYQKSM